MQGREPGRRRLGRRGRQYQAGVPRMPALPVLRGEMHAAQPSGPPSARPASPRGPGRRARVSAGCVAPAADSGVRAEGPPSRENWGSREAPRCRSGSGRSFLRRGPRASPGPGGAGAGRRGRARTTGSAPRPGERVPGARPYAETLRAPRCSCPSRSPRCSAHAAPTAPAGVQTGRHRPFVQEVAPGEVLPGESCLAHQGHLVVAVGDAEHAADPGRRRR